MASSSHVVPKTVAFTTAMWCGRSARSVLRRNLGVAATAAWSTRGIASATRPLFEKRTMNVPSMGDSITEGTIVEWTAEIGQAVKDGDVVALVETDKVTVEIKAVVDGVITQRFGAVDDTVEVGAKLYELDTDAAATVEASSASDSTKGSTPAPPAQVAVKSEAIKAESDAPVESAHRSPLIKFLGKEGWEAVRKSHGSPTTPASPVTASSSSPTKQASPHAVHTIFDNTIIHPMYGRPRFTEAEMEALLTGGATLAPQVLAHSSGAKFKT